MSGRLDLEALSQAAAAAMPFVPLCTQVDGEPPDGAPESDGSRSEAAAGRRGGDGFRCLCWRLSARVRAGWPYSVASWS